MLKEGGQKKVTQCDLGSDCVVYFSAITIIRLLSLLKVKETNLNKGELG